MCRSHPLFASWEDGLDGRTDYHDRVARSVKRVFERNIVLGNALSMKRVDGLHKEVWLSVGV